jgi:alpha-L-fucosidase
MRRSLVAALAVVLVAAPAALGADAASPAAGKEAPLDPRLQWFVDAKLGIFLHWGLYSVFGIPESWAFYNGEITYENYMQQKGGFTAARYDPAAWAALFKEAGARYAVLTSKHHEGFALWDTRLGALNVMQTPAKRDLLAPYAAALRAEGLKVGFYFSHLDWSHPDYATVRPKDMKPTERGNPLGFPEAGKEDPARWQRFLAFHRGQIKELSERYKPDLFWFDGDWERDAEQWDMKGLREQILSWQPDAILNSRMRGFGDYATPEQGMPIVPPEGPWELCMTVNDSWGYQFRDHNHKPTGQIIRTFAEIVSMGGNLLLDIGPYADGSLQPEQVERLKGLGRWTRKHAEAIYGTLRGLPFGHFYGPTTLSKDRRTLYLFVFDTPRDAIAVKGVRNKIERVFVVGRGETATWSRSGGADWMNIPGTLRIDVPKEALDDEVTVIGVRLEGALDLYHAAGGAAESK